MKRLIVTFTTLLIAINIQAQKPFGVLVNIAGGKANAMTKIEVAKKLGVPYVRTAINMDNWDGSDKIYEAYEKAGFKILLNINYGRVAKDGIKSPVAFPKDTVAYKKILDEILSKYRPEVVVIENEELIPKYHTGSAQDYINELTAAVHVAHSKGLKITNGGLTNKELVLLVYRDFIKRGMAKEANKFGRLTMKDKFLQAAQNPETNSEADNLYSMADSLIRAYHDLDIDYINVHIYEPVKPREENKTNITPNVIKIISDYVVKATGKPVMSNECGERSNSPTLVSAMLEEFLKNNYKYIIWFSGDGEGGAISLNNPDGSLRPNGEAFKNFIEKYK